MKQIEGMQTSDHILQMILSELCSQMNDASVELTQEVLAKQLGVSRMPVREALLVLAHDGYALRKRSRHIYSYPITQEMFRDNIQVMASVEKTLLLQLQQKHIFDKQLILMLDARGRNFSSVQFHMMVGELCDNPYIKKTLENMIRGYYSLALSGKKESNVLLERLRPIANELNTGTSKALEKAVDNFYAKWMEEILE